MTPRHAIPFSINKESNVFYEEHDTPRIPNGFSANMCYIQEENPTRVIKLRPAPWFGAKKKLDGKRADSKTMRQLIRF